MHFEKMKEVMSYYRTIFSVDWLVATGAVWRSGWALVLICFRVYIIENDYERWTKCEREASTRTIALNKTIRKEQSLLLQNKSNKWLKKINDDHRYLYEKRENPQQRTRTLIKVHRKGKSILEVCRISNKGVHSVGLKQQIFQHDGRHTHFYCALDEKRNSMIRQKR